MASRGSLGAAGFLLAAAALGACGRSEPKPDVACHLGGYRMADGRVMGLVPRDKFELRYVFLTGETGVVHELAPGVWSSSKDDPGGEIKLLFGDCDDPKIHFVNPDWSRLIGRKVEAKVLETTFRGVDGRRAGRLVLPEDGSPKAIVVAVHGSERASGRTGDRLQALLPAYGIGVFAWDKRGTGRSSGAYTQDFEILSEDALRARNEARRLADAGVPIGYLGGSQGGWVAPLAAAKAGADFVVVVYGMAESPLAEDREEVFQDLRRAGWGEDVIEKAREITEITGRAMASDFKEGMDEMAAVRARYEDEPWFGDLGGEFTGEFMKRPNWMIRLMAPFFDVGTSWDYDPRPALDAIEGPHLWVLAEKDREAPHEGTLAILKEIQQSRPNLDIVVFPDTDHGIYEFVEDAEGNRTPVRFAPGYYGLLRDFILTYRTTIEAEGPAVYRGKDVAAESDDGLE